jgi:hypothetical protein
MSGGIRAAAPKRRHPVCRKTISLAFWRKDYSSLRINRFTVAVIFVLFLPGSGSAQNPNFAGEWRTRRDQIALGVPPHPVAIDTFAAIILDEPNVSGS